MPWKNFKLVSAEKNSVGEALRLCYCILPLDRVSFLTIRITEKTMQSVETLPPSSHQSVVVRCSVLLLLELVELELDDI